MTGLTREELPPAESSSKWRMGEVHSWIGKPNAAGDI